MQCPKCGNAMFLLLYTHKCYACEDAKKAIAEKKLAEASKKKYTYYTIEGPQPLWSPWGNLTWTIAIWDDLSLAKEYLKDSDPDEYIIQIHCDEEIEPRLVARGDIIVAFTPDYVTQHTYVDPQSKIYVVEHGGKIA